MCTKVYALVLMLFAAVSVYGQDNEIGRASCRERVFVPV